jgi:hypothetical protein
MQRQPDVTVRGGGTVYVFHPESAWLTTGSMTTSTSKAGSGSGVRSPSSTASQVRS